MITEEQKRRRHAGIFASDVPRVMAGYEVDVYLEKIGEKPPVDLSEVNYVQLGNLLEAPVLDAYERAHGSILTRAPDTLMHPVAGWLGAHLDALDAGRPVEAKTVGVYNRREWGEAGTDQVPDRVLWQTQAQMAVVGAREALVPVAFATEENLMRFVVSGRVEISLYVVARSERMIEALIERCGRLWRAIEERRAPEPGSVADAALLYDYDKGTIVQANEADLANFHALRQLQAGLRWIEQKIEEHEALLQASMKHHSELRHQGETLATWRRSKDSEMLDSDAVRRADPALWARSLKIRKGSRVFRLKSDETARAPEQLTMTELSLADLGIKEKA